MPSPRCLLCFGPYPADLVIKLRSAKAIGEPMTVEEFTDWLKYLGKDSARSPIGPQ